LTGKCSSVVLLMIFVLLLPIMQAYCLLGTVRATSQAPRQVSCTITNTITNPGSGNQYTLQPLTFGGISTNMWNTVSSVGDVEQCVGETGLQTTISLNDIQYDLQGAPAGSPEIGYGIDSFDVGFGPLSTKTTLSSFPMLASSFDNLNYWISVGYSLGSPSPPGLTIDLVYDLWIETAPSPGVGPQSGDLEVMLFLYGSNALPDGSSVCLSCFSETNPTGQSSVWSIYRGIGGAGTTTITFLLTSPTPTSTGSIDVRLQDFIEKALLIHPMSASSELMGIELGTEFGGTYPAQPSASWGWTISSLVLQNSCDTLELLPVGSESVCSAQSTVSLTLSPNSIALGSSVTLSGSISPNPGPVLVTVSFSRDAGTTWAILMSFMTDGSGDYGTSWAPSTPGDYLLEASWGGNNQLAPSQSSPESLTVTGAVSPTPSVLLSSPATTSHGQVLTLSITVFNPSSWTLNANVSIMITGPSDYVLFDVIQVKVNGISQSTRYYDWSVPTQTGSYAIMLAFMPPTLGTVEFEAIQVT